MNGMSREDVLKQLYIINGYYNAAINGELVYNNKKTFHFEKDPDNEGNYIPFDVTANLVDGKMAIDCATFTQLVAHSILYSQSPYKKNYYFTSQFGTPYNYLQKNVVKYWEHYYKDHYAGRLLTWQWAKFLSDYGALMLVPNKLLNGTSDSIYTCNGKYIGNYTPQPGDHIFMRSDEVKGTYLSISHCAIIFDAHFKADNTSEVLIVDSANTTDTPNGINIRALSSEDRNRICAVYRPTFGYGFQFVKYHNVTSVKKSDNTLNLTIRYPVEVALRCHASVDHNTVSVKNTDSVGNIISEFESRTMGANNAYTFFAIPGNLELTVNSTSDATYFDVELKNF